MRFLFLAPLLLTGCMTIAPDQYPITDEPRTFTYDYQVPGKTKSQIFRSAQQHFALAYGDSRAVSRSADDEDGTYIGKAIVSWNMKIDGLLIPHIACASNYNIVFIAKDGKARLQLSLLDGTVAPANCALPPKRDYPQIVASFNATSKKLEEALNGKSSMEALKNF